MKKYFLALLLLIIAAIAHSQNTLSTLPQLQNTNGATSITFEIESTTPILLEEIASIFNNGQVNSNVWIRLGGVQSKRGVAPQISVANGWQQVITNVPVTGNQTTQSFIPGGPFNIPIPANTPVGVVIQGNQRHARFNNQDSITTFTDGTLTIRTGKDAGYAGTAFFPHLSVRQFLGSLSYSLAPQCAGLPSAGTVVATDTVPCLGDLVLFKLANSSFEGGITYQWESSADGINWQVLTGDTLPVLHKEITGASFYRCGSSCGGQTAFSSPVQVVPTGTGLPAGNYTINSAQPTGNGNYANFNEFFSSVSCGGISGPIVLDVVAGSGPYNEQVVIPHIGGTNAINTLTINGNNETIEFAPTASFPVGVVTFDNAQYVTLNNFTINVLQLANGVGVHIVNSSRFIQVTNCTIDMSFINNTSQTGISVNTANNSLSTNLVSSFSEYITIAGNTTISGNIGIEVVGYAAIYLGHGNRIINNTIQDFRLMGIHSMFQNGIEISKNTLTTTIRRNNALMTGLRIMFTHQNTVIEGNSISYPFQTLPMISHSGIRGINLNSASGTPTSPNFMYNNIIFNLVSSSSVRGLLLANSSHWKVYHNSISLMDTVVSPASSRGLEIQNHCDGLEFFNNIVSIRSNGTSFVVHNTSSGNIAINHNGYYLDYSKGAPTFGFSNATVLNQFSDWITSSSGFDGASVFDEPGFLNEQTGLLIPNSSLFDNLGTNLLQVVPKDFLDSSRTIHPDIGAFEYELSGCVRPAISLNHLADTIAYLSWTINGIGPLATFEIEYGPIGFTRGSGTYISSSTSFIQLDSLLPNSCYDVFVRANCEGDSSVFSPWSTRFSFCTECSVIIPPYYQDFENWASGIGFNFPYEPCYHSWNNFSHTAHSKWRVFEATSSIANFIGISSGAKNTFKFTALSVSGHVNPGEISSIEFPKVNLNVLTSPELVFHYLLSGINVNELSVQASVDNGLTWTTIWSTQGETRMAGNISYFIAHVSLDSVKSAATTIRFTYTKAQEAVAYALVDEVFIGEAEPCPKPYLVTIIDSTSTSATVDWIQNGNVSNWIYQVLPQGSPFNPASSSYDSTTIHPIVLNNLSPGNCYDIYLKSACGTHQDWVGPVGFCLPIFYDVELSRVLTPVNHSCVGADIPIAVEVKNLGMMPATNFSVVAEITSPTTQILTYQYTNTLSSGATDSIFVGNYLAPYGGTLHLSVEIDNLPDENNDNNEASVTRNLVEVVPIIATATADTICDNQQTLLIADHPDQLEIEWRDQSNSLLGIGDSIVISNLNGPITAVALAYQKVLESVGPENPNFGNSVLLSPNLGSRLAFSVLEPVRIKRFTIYPSQAGILSVRVSSQQNQNNFTDYSITVPSPATPNAAVTLDVDIPLTVGDFFIAPSLFNSTVGSLLVNNVGATYPYSTVNGEFVITGNTNSTISYLYFYDFITEITTNCSVSSNTVSIYPAPYAVFSHDAASGAGASPTGYTVNFDATGSVGDSFIWYFGDGGTGSGIQTSHTYATYGNYSVRLEVHSKCGSKNRIQNVFISGLSSHEVFTSDLKVYPNPSTSFVNIEFVNSISQPVNIRLMNANGQQVWESKIDLTIGEQLLTIDLNPYAKGIYILQVQTENGIVNRRLSLM
ncbi:MAG: T9SS type A sorting domain-containing protein [Schleiferiaceae bacterium]|nr:T9SS type A sorting domain-containing protein [Schleiferiaceae bacterium]